MRQPKPYELTIEQTRQGSIKAARQARQSRVIKYRPEPGMQIVIGRMYETTRFYRSYYLGLARCGDVYLLIGLPLLDNQAWQYMRRATAEDIAAFVAVNLQDGILSTHLGYASRSTTPISRSILDRLNARDRC